jgi:hypothetical protein
MASMIRFPTTIKVGNPRLTRRCVRSSVEFYSPCTRSLAQLSVPLDFTNPDASFCRTAVELENQACPLRIKHTKMLSRLAVIMVVDVVDYSLLMDMGEVSTIRAIQSLKNTCPSSKLSGYLSI